MKVLCLCRAGLNRSRYIADVLRARGHEAMYAGVDPRAPNPVTQEMLAWADLIVTARNVHADVLKERFDVKKPILSLDVRNNIYADMSMRTQVEEQLKGFNPA